jgi:transcriptional regulator
VIAACPLATVVSQGEAFPTISQVPLIFSEEDSSLRGHFDRNNPHCAHILDGGNIYCLFNGPNHYITPSIYPDTQYPGWNYVSVHVKGMVSPVEDEAWLRALLLRTAELNEPADSGYRLEPTQENFGELIKLILGFRIEIVEMEGIFKLAQDKGSGHAELARQHLAAMAGKDVNEFLSELLE